MARQKMQNQNFDESIQWISRISDPELRQEIISEGLYGSGSNIFVSGIRPSSATISSIDHILNNPIRTNRDFIGTVDRVHIPGIPSPSLSPTNQVKFREAAERAGLIPPSPE